MKNDLSLTIIKVGFLVTFFFFLKIYRFYTAAGLGFLYTFYISIYFLISFVAYFFFFLLAFFFFVLLERGMAEVAGV